MDCGTGFYRIFVHGVLSRYGQSSVHQSVKVSSGLEWKEVKCSDSVKTTTSAIRANRSPLKLRPYGAIQMCILLSKADYIEYNSGENIGIICQ